MQDILAQIRLQYNRFTKTEKLVADYVLAQPNQVVYQSIGDLATASRVSETTVFRFCRALGQKGYQAFKMHLAQALAATSQEAAALQHTGAVGFGDDLEVLAQKVFSCHMSALGETLNALDYKDLRQVVRWMAGPGAIYFFGVGDSMVAALEAQSRFMRITSKTHMYQDLHLQLMAASLMAPEDVAVLFSYSGATKDTLHIAAQAKEKGARLVGVSRYPRSSLSKLCDIVLLCGATEGPLQGGSTAVKMAQLFLLDVLYLEFFKQTRELSTRQRKHSAAAITEQFQ